MKNILIVCIQGLTSSIMAKKLTMCAQNKGEDFCFKAAGIESMQQYTEWADVILVTPQIETSIQKIENIIGNNEIKIKILAKSTLALGSTEMTYEKIKQAIDGNTGRIPFGKIVKLLFLDALCFSIVILLCGSLAEIIYVKTQIEIFHEVFVKTAGIACVYISCFLGGRMGHYTNYSKHIFGMIGLSSALMFATANIKFQGSNSLKFSELAVYASYKWNLLWIPIMIILLSIFYLIFDITYRWNQKKNYIISGYLCAAYIIPIVIYHIFLFILYCFFFFYTSKILHF